MAFIFVVYVVDLSCLVVDSQLWYVVFQWCGVLLAEVVVLCTEGLGTRWNLYFVLVW